MIRNILCYYCKKTLLPIEGFYHDDKFNLYCNLCNNIIFCATKEQENTKKPEIQKNIGVVDNYRRRDCFPIRISNNNTTTTTTTTVEQNDYCWWG